MIMLPREDQVWKKRHLNFPSSGLLRDAEPDAFLRLSKTP